MLHLITGHCYPNNWKSVDANSFSKHNTSRMYLRELKSFFHAKWKLVLPVALWSTSNAGQNTVNYTCKCIVNDFINASKWMSKWATVFNTAIWGSLLISMYGKCFHHAINRFDPCNVNSCISNVVIYDTDQVITSQKILKPKVRILTKSVDF